MTPNETIETRLASILREPMTASQAAYLDGRVSDARERERPASRSGRTLTSGRGLFRRRLVLAVGLALLLLTSLVVSLPTQSKPTYQAQLRAAGVPEGVEIDRLGGRREGQPPRHHVPRQGRAGPPRQPVLRLQVQGPRRHAVQVGRPAQGDASASPVGVTPSRRRAAVSPAAWLWSRWYRAHGPPLRLGSSWRHPSRPDRLHDVAWRSYS